MGLLDKFKHFTSVKIADRDSVLFWKEKWKGPPLQITTPELFSFARNENITFQLAISKEDFLQNLNLPLSTQAHQQLLHLHNDIMSTEAIQGYDQWVYNWGNPSFATNKVYKLLMAGDSAHPVYLWLCRMKYQMKHKVFSWLFLKDRLSTRDILGSKDMELDSHTRDLCILQKRETVAHLFLLCNFAKQAKACWETLGVTYISSRTILQICRAIKRNLVVPFSMDIQNIKIAN